jgi:glycosyltransferase involved in cell wall biosynthesis
MSNLNLEYEHVVIDNSSTDNTIKYIKEIAQTDKNFKAIINNRNYGQIKSPFYGLIDSNADATILMVADLQDPIELIPKLIEEFKKGFEIVLLQKKFNNENFFYKIIKNNYYKLLNILSEHSPDRNIIGSGIYSSSVVNILKNIYDPSPYLRGLIYEIGFNIKLIPFDQPKRKKGISKNNFLSLLDYGILGIVKHTKLARFLTIFGFCFSFISLLVALIFFILKILFWGSFSFGIAPIIIGLFALSGIQMFFLGLIGEYVIVILDYNIKLPLIIEKERINF